MSLNSRDTLELSALLCVLNENFYCHKPALAHGHTWFQFSLNLKDARLSWSHLMLRKDMNRMSGEHCGFRQPNRCIGGQFLLKTSNLPGFSGSSSLDDGSKCPVDFIEFCLWIGGIDKLEISIGRIRGAFSQSFGSFPTIRPSLSSANWFNSPISFHPNEIAPKRKSAHSTN